MIQEKLTHNGREIKKNIEGTSISVLDEHLINCQEQDCIIRKKQKYSWKIINNEWVYIKEGLK